MVLKIIILLFILINYNTDIVKSAENIITSKSISMHGEPALNDNFLHLDYVNPNAKKGGTFKLASLGTFDSTNPFVIKGRSAYGIRDYVYESLLKRNYSEPFSLYKFVLNVRLEMMDRRSCR